MVCSPPGSSVHGILWARKLEWGVCPFLLQGIVQTRDRTQVSCVSCVGKWVLYHWYHSVRPTLQQLYVEKSKDPPLSHGQLHVPPGSVEDVEFTCWYVTSGAAAVEML